MTDIWHFLRRLLRWRERRTALERLRPEDPAMTFARADAEAWRRSLETGTPHIARRTRGRWVVEAF